MEAMKQKHTMNKAGYFESRSALLLGIALLVTAVSLLLGPLLGQQAAVPALAPVIVDTNAILSTGAGTSTGYADRIITDMQARISTQPGDSRAYFLLGTAYQQKARETNDPAYYSESERALRKALEMKPDDYDALAGMGTLDLSRHNFREALQWGIQAQQLLPERAYAYGVIGDAQIELGTYNEAVDTFQRMVNLRPDLSSYSRVSYARELHGDVFGAIQAMQQAVAAGGPAAENTAWCRVQLGNLYFHSNNLVEAEKAYSQALATYPNYLHAQAGLAQVRWAQGRYDEAIDLYKQSVSNVPLPQYLTALGDLYSSNGDTKAAEEQYDLVSYIYGLFEKNGMNVDIEKAAFLADHDIDLPDALQKAEAAASQRRDVHTLDTLAWARYKNGHYSEALQAQRDAMRLGTQNPLFYYHLGMIQNKLGMESEAHASVQTALDINPHFSPRHSAQARDFVKSSKVDR